MKLILVSDLHLMGRTPVSRTDDFPETQANKISQVDNLSHKYSNCPVLQAGDFFDSYNPSFRLMNRYINMLGYPSNWYAVLGQHDMYMWSLDSIDRTALGVLEAADCISILRSEVALDYGVKVYGCSWGQEIPKIRGANEFNILVIHKNIGDKALFPGHDLVNPRRFLNKHKFDLILCGDYHFPFEYTNGDRTILNTGVICRKSIAEKDIHPSVILYDTEIRKYEWIELKHERDPFTNKEKVKKESMIGNIDLSDFLGNIDATEPTKISFKDNVMKALEVKGIKKEVKQKAIDILNMEE